ncbi:transferase [Aureococcus anophagefferens]|nr:transferase [Aureococcus anophagefferens]
MLLRLGHDALPTTAPATRDVASPEEVAPLADDEAHTPSPLANEAAVGTPLEIAAPAGAAAPPDDGGYRADIDGLRAAAVAAVVAFHIDEAAYPAGRWRRPERDEKREVEATGGVTDDAGGYFTSYGDADRAPHRLDRNPFMHTWSLGVEEQFYVIFPLIAFASRGRCSELTDPSTGDIAALAGPCLDPGGRRRPAAFYLLATRANAIAPAAGGARGSSLQLRAMTVGHGCGYSSRAFNAAVMAYFGHDGDELSDRCRTYEDEVRTKLDAVLAPGDVLAVATATYKFFGKKSRTGSRTTTTCGT